MDNKYKAAWAAKKRASNKLAVIAHYGGKCEICTEDNHSFLAIDHINGNGRKHRKSLGIIDGHRFYSWIISQGFPSGYRILCHNHNIIAHLSNKILSIDEIRDERRKITKECVLRHYGPSGCVCCGFNDIKALTIDHVDGGGNDHMKSLNLKWGHGFYRWLLRNNLPNGFQTLCMNCNMSKSFNGICQHELITNLI